MKIKNITNGPKGVNTLSGPVEIASGAVVDVKMNDAEVASSKAIGWFEFGGKAKADEPVKFDPDKATVAELQAFLAEAGVELKGDEKKPELVELAKAV